MNDTRGTGRTSHQLINAPPNAIFIWCNTRTDYPRKLAAELNRRDIKIVSPGWIEGIGPYGINFNDVVIDHMAEEMMNKNQKLCLLQHKTLRTR